MLYNYPFIFSIRLLHILSLSLSLNHTNCSSPFHSFLFFSTSLLLLSCLLSTCFRLIVLPKYLCSSPVFFLCIFRFVSLSLFLSIATRRRRCCRGASIDAVVAILLGRLAGGPLLATSTRSIYIRFRYNGRTPRYLSPHSGRRRCPFASLRCALLLKCRRSL